MSKLLTITPNPNTVNGYFVNRILFTEPPVFRATWSILEDFERTYGQQIDKIPKDFIKDIKELVESVAKRPGQDVYRLLEDFANQFQKCPKIHQFRIPKTIYAFGDEASLRLETINQQLIANIYQFKTFASYPETTLVIDFLKDLGVYEKVHQDLVEAEVESTLFEDWTTWENRDDEINYYNNLSDDEKKVFAHGYAYTFVNGLMPMTLVEFERQIGFDYIDAYLEYERERDYYKFDLSTFYALKN